MQMYDVARKQRFSRLERSIDDEPSRTFQLRRFEGIPQYTGVLHAVSSFSQRDEDDITVVRRRSPPPPSGCRYSLTFLLTLSVVFVVMCMQFTHGIPTRFVSRVLQEADKRTNERVDERCPVCTCVTNST